MIKIQKSLKNGYVVSHDNLRTSYSNYNAEDKKDLYFVLKKIVFEDHNDFLNSENYKSENEKSALKTMWDESYEWEKVLMISFIFTLLVIFTGFIAILSLSFL